MCLAALSLGQSSVYPLVLAANRDEFWARPAAAMDWWESPQGRSGILSGRDLEAGGTWLGLNRDGRVALLTNVREPGNHRFDAPSRGNLVVDWLDSAESTDAFWQRHAALPYNGFNLIGGDLASGQWVWGSNRATPQTMAPLRQGRLYGLSNAALDTPWPKLQALKRRMAVALDAAGSGDSPGVEGLAWSLLTALADQSAPPEALLPATGVPIEWEKALAPAFIDAPERQYGTRCSTVLIVERRQSGTTLHAFELTHAVTPGQPRPDPILAAASASALSGGSALSSLRALRRIAVDAWPSGATR